MGWLILGIVLCLVAVAGFIGIFVSFEEGGFVLGAISSFIAVGSFIAFSRGLNERACDRFGEVSGYDTEIVIVNRFDGGTCWVDVGDRTVPRDQLWFEQSGRPR
jgi:hypothetical protein